MKMEKFTVLKGQAASLGRPNVDTDVIIPIDRLAAYRRAELGRFAFEAWRYRADGSEDPAFVLNTPAFRGATILVAGPNFGCGSSREHAVWALQGMGLRCVVAPSFGDIFFGNCFQSGVLPIVLPADVVGAIAADVEAAGTAATTVDLEQELLVTPQGRRHAFQIEPVRRTQLLEGLDEIALTLRSAELIDSFQLADRAARPWIYETEGVTIHADH